MLVNTSCFFSLVPQLVKPNAKVKTITIAKIPVIVLFIIIISYHVKINSVLILNDTSQTLPFLSVNLPVQTLTKSISLP